MTTNALVPKNDRLTIQQRTAVERRGRSVVLSSGAGCGKTHVLTARYLRHLREDQVAIGQLVAITFTERAARQMRDRIRQAIRLEVSLATSPEMRERWDRHLRDLEQATITTIHGFCGNILRQHAFAAGMDPSFEVLDEVLAENLRNEALTQTLRKTLTAEGELGDALRDLVVRYGWKDIQASIKSLMFDADPGAWEAWIALDEDVILRKWLLERQKLLPEWVEYQLATGRVLRSALRIIDIHKPSTPEYSRRRLRLLEGIVNLAKASNLDEELADLREQTLLGRAPAKHWPVGVPMSEISKGYEDLRKQIDERFTGFGPTFTNEPGVIESIQVGKRFLLVALEVVRDYQERKRRAMVVDFHDLIQGARNLLRDEASARDALRQRFQYVLLDELQDTDPAQMELVRLLCGGGLIGDKLFAVGDHKQSIYRFRGADVGLFLDLRAELGQEGRLELTQNFRSQPQILDFVNGLFTKRLDHYEPLDPSGEERHGGHCVEFLWATPERGVQFQMQTGRQLEADAIARRIGDMLDDPTPRIWDPKLEQLRRIERGDIVLLFRSMTQVGVYETALRRHGIDYYLIGGRAFFAQQEIYDVLNLLRALENPWDDLSLTGVLRSPFGCVRDDSLMLISRCREGLWKGLFDEAILGTLDLNQRIVVERARAWLVDWREWKDRLPIAELLLRVIGDAGYDAALQFEYLGERKLANLWKLVDLARNFDRSGLFSTVDFIARLNEMVKNKPPEEEAATLPESADVVKLMSIHQSKGLEYPVVFVVNIAATVRGDSRFHMQWHNTLGALVKPPSDDPERFDTAGWKIADRLESIADWKESLRVLYVACTRARDLLILSSGVPDEINRTIPGYPPIPPFMADGPWMMALAERFHLITGVPFGKGVVDVQVVVSQVKPSKQPPRRRAHAEDAGRLPDAPPPAIVPPLPTVMSLLALEAIACEFPKSDMDITRRNARLEGGRIAWDLGEGPRNRWEELADQRDPILARREATFRRLLSRWNPHDPTSWPMLLSQARLPREDEPTLTAWFSTLESSAFMSGWRSGSECVWHTEFVIGWPENDPTMTLCSIIDGMFVDGHGVTQVAILDTDGRSAQRDWASRAAIIAGVIDPGVVMHRIDLIGGMSEIMPIVAGVTGIERWLAEVRVSSISVGLDQES